MIRERAQDSVVGRELEGADLNSLAIGGDTISGITPPTTRLSVSRSDVTTTSDTVAVTVLSRAHSITAVVEIPALGAEGVILSHGNGAGGYALFVQEDYLHYVHNYCGALELHAVSLDPMPSGRVRVRVDFEPTRGNTGLRGSARPGRTQLFFDDRMVADKIFPVTVPLAVGNTCGLSIGRNSGTAVSHLYEAPFAFTGKIVSVRYDLSNRAGIDSEDGRPIVHLTTPSEH